MRHASRRLLVAAAAIATAVVAASTASAADLWTETGSTTTSVNYWQGITFDAASRAFAFDGPARGLWRTDAQLTRLAGRSAGIPSTVTASEGWNHLGDLSFDAVGGRLLVPLECYYPAAADPNTCRTGGIGVVDPVTLQWRSYAKLDPVQIAKAMWVEVSPDGRWVWTSSGIDLLAYDASQLASPPPGGAPLAAAKRIVGILRSPNVSGAAFSADRLYLAFDRGSYIQVLSYPVTPATGDIGTTWRLEIQLTKTSARYETEGLTFADALGGTLHWQIQPQTPLFSRIVHYTPAG